MPFAAFQIGSRVGAAAEFCLSKLLKFLELKSEGVVCESIVGLRGMLS